MATLHAEDLELLRDTAARFFSEQLPVDALRALRDGRDESGFDRDKWHAMVAMGWPGILIGEDYGGVDFGYTALGHILEQSGRMLAASPLVATALLGAPLLAQGESARCRETLQAVVAGECLLALALEEGRYHAPANIATRAVTSANGYTISGRKTFVLDGHIADQIIVLARTHGADHDAGGLTLFLIDAAACGIRCERTVMVDARNAAQIEFEGVSVAADCIIGAPDVGFELLQPILDGARAGLAAEMLGSGEEAFDRTLEYLKVRQQFDVPIGSFQALKHRAAQMYCEVELARSATYAALAACDSDADAAAELACVAKAKACDMIELVTNEAIQMHGGIGMTDAADIGLFLKRARVAQQTLGDARYHRARYAQLLGL